MPETETAISEDGSASLDDEYAGDTEDTQIPDPDPSDEADPDTGDGSDPEEPDLTPELETETHLAYIKGSGDNVSPNKKLTRAEICSIVCSLLKNKPEGIDPAILPSDVKPDAWYAEYISSLLKLEVIEPRSDGLFHPNSYATRAELVQVLDHFFPRPEELTSKFTDVPESHPAYEAILAATTRGWIEGYGNGKFKPDNPVIRSEAIAIVNRALGRKADKARIERDGKVLMYLDLSMTHWAYYDIMEASLPHEHTTDGTEETWDSYTIPESKRQPGYYNISGELYCIDENRHWVHDKTIGVLTFNSRGRYTTGNSDLDSRLTSLVAGQMKSGLSNLENFRRVHNYVASHYNYRGGTYLKDGQTGWEEQMALEMLKNKAGNCYRYAGLETMLARKFGYQAVGVSGYINRGSGFVFHGWTQVDDNGKTKLCDLQQANAQRVNSSLRKWDTCMRTYSDAKSNGISYRVEGKVLK